MDLKALAVRLLAAHQGRPQEIREIELALHQLGEDLSTLARLGHQFHLEEGAPLALPEWPRVMFHIDSAPNGRVVHSQWELADLGEGWYPTLTEAQHADGVKTQFAGRGGIGVRNLPVPVAGPDPADEAAVRAALDDFIARWKAAHPKGETTDADR